MANTAKKKKVAPIRIVLVILLVIVLVLVVVVKLSPSWDKSESAVIFMSGGNRGGNLANGGTVLEAGGHIYLSDPVSGQIMKTEPGNTTGAPLGDLRGRYLNSDGVGLWYVDQDTEKLMKTDLNGAAPTEFLPVRVSQPTLMGEYIYFIDVDNHHLLCRVKKDGSSSVEILDARARVQQFAILGEQIFYTNLNSDGNASYISLDGSLYTDANQLYMGQVVFTQGSRLYFTNQQRDGALDSYELFEDGSYSAMASTLAGSVFEASVNTGSISCAVADDKHIYYVKATDGCLYRRGVQASSAADIIEEKLTDFPVYGLQDTQNHVYYRSVVENGAYYTYAKS